jgi:organic radical activating enzyme
MDNKTFSCRFLQRAVYYAPNELRHCCKRFFYNGKLKGDVKILSIKSQKDVSLDSIIKEKEILINKINNGEETECTGCPVLEKSNWNNLKDEKFDHISIEHHSKCNMRCSYCSDVYYGGKLANYNLVQSLDELVAKKKIRDDAQVAWGGGEPTMSPDFKSLINYVNTSVKPKTQRFFSNAVNFSEEIADLLRKNIASLTTSVDAGSIETFKEVRGVNQYKKVLNNLKKYFDASNNNTVIKYIFTETNSNLNDVNGFVKDIRKIGLSKANFLISSNFKDENLTLDQGFFIIYLHSLLTSNGALTCVLDDHVRPRINKISNDLMSANANILNYPIEIKLAINKIKKTKENLSEIIVWGIGEYANLLLDKSFTFQDVKVKFFVDSNLHKQGTVFRGLEVFNPNIVKKHDNPILIASSFWYHDICNQLKDLGVDGSRIYSSSLI